MFSRLSHINSCVILGIKRLRQQIYNSQLTSTHSRGKEGQPWARRKWPRQQQSANQHSQQRKGRSALGKENVSKAANLQQSCVLTCSTVAMSTHSMIMLSVIVLHFSSLTLACKPASEKTPTEGKSYTIYTSLLLKTSEIKPIFCI